jgi:EAL domain-containing protein (putative c-di-GMP-specific phosphodiesterase class I)
MYQAKGQGRNRTVVFDTAMRQEALDRLEIQRDLRRAVRRGEITLHYQPVVELATGQISGLEALARWQHPERGLLGPHQFIPVAEQHGMIEELGHHIIDLALGDARILAEASGRDDLQMAVNVSAHQLDDAHLDRLVEDLCRHHRWDPVHLVLEITESALTREVDRPARLLDRLQDLGVRLSIDDFGTGYSSLARLGRLLVDQVKLDRSFVAAIDDPANRLVRLIDAVVAIGDRLGIEVVGEGVETASQLDHLRAIGCTHAQGFLFARPAPRDEIVALLSNRPTW